MKRAGTDLDVVLRGNAVNYVVKREDASGLVFGSERQTQPSYLTEDVSKLIGKGVNVFIVHENLAALGIEQNELMSGLKPITVASMPELFANCDRVWHW